MAFDMKDYVEVADRIHAWYERYPDGRIVTEILEHTEDRVVVKADAFRGPQGFPAGTGHSFLAIPGATPYTKGSELENAETSAVGRALVMAGIPAKNVASAGEVKSKQSTGGAVREGAATETQAGPPIRTRVEAKPSPSGVAGVGAEIPGEERAGPCPGCGSIASSLLNPGGKPLPKGYVRCTDCQLTRKAEGISK
jgi:hypothetical protein